MSFEPTQYMSEDKLEALQAEKKQLSSVKIPELAKRIDEARQMGDLSENAEYHAAREEMAWAQSRVQEIDYLLQNAQIIVGGKKTGSTVAIGSTVTVEVHGKKKEYTIVGAQEADPLTGKISNESPLGQAFLGKKKDDRVSVEVPAGVQVYKIVEIH